MNAAKINSRKYLLVAASLFIAALSWTKLRRRPSFGEVLPPIGAQTELQILRDAPAPKEDFDGTKGEGSTSLLQEVQDSAVPAVQTAPTDSSDAAQAPKDTRAVVSQNLIPDILNLGQDQPIPASLFARHDTNAIAESLVERLHRREAAPSPATPPAGAVDMWADTELHHYASSKDFLRIVREGFKNQFQTGTSGGFLNLPLRNKAEQKLIGTELTQDFHDMTINQLRPIYGAVFYKSETMSSFMGSYVYLVQYGDFIAIFKDQLKLRSTWIKGDSVRLDFTSGGTFWNRSPIDPSRAREFLIECQTWGRIRIEDVKAIGITQKTPQNFRDQVIAAGFQVIDFKGTDDADFGKILSEGNPKTLAKWINDVRAGKIPDPMAAATKPD